MLNKLKKITKLLPRLFLSLLLVAISLQTAGLLFFTWTPNVAQAKPIEMNLQVPIPGLPSTIKFSDSTEPIAKYVQAIYNYAIGIVGVLAAVVMMIGGLMWITAGGNTSNIGEAKTMITASLTGLVLVLTSYLLLSMVNPALVNLQSSVIGSVEKISTEQNCVWITGGKTDTLTCAEGFTKTTKVKLCGPAPEMSKESAKISCCCSTMATGNCKPASGGSCAPENLTVFGSRAEQASAICQGESGGSPGIPSGTDICADGNPASWGLFQINISANKIGNLNCPSAFSSAYTASNHSCRVIDQNLYDRCVTAAKDPATNTNQAYIIYSKAGNSWMPWGYYQRACSQSSLFN